MNSFNTIKVQIYSTDIVKIKRKISKRQTQKKKSANLLIEEYKSNTKQNKTKKLKINTAKMLEFVFKLSLNDAALILGEIKKRYNCVWELNTI